MYENNPDSRLAVRFYQKAVENEWRTSQEGRPISFMADFVRIEVPGDMTTVIDTFVNDDHKKRFPIQWAQYLNEKAEGQVSEAQGTLLRDWSLLTPAQVNDLKHYKFFTVEQVANASDQQIQSLGMMLGMSGFTFRDRAKAFLANAKDSSVVIAQADELRRRDQEIAELKAQMEELVRAVNAPKRGRPTKEEAAAKEET